MGQEEDKDKERLIDFLYRDSARIDSFYAQLFRGALREIHKTRELTSTSSFGINGGVGFIEGQHSQSRTVGNLIAETMDPHDQKILDLIDALEISPLETPLSDFDNGQIILVNGQIVIRNYEAMKAIPDAISAIVGLNMGLNKQERKEQKRESKAIIAMLKLIPTGLELEIFTSRGESLIGVIKPEYLSQSPNDLLRVYGNHIPGDWYILGIIEDIASRKPFPPSSDFRKGIDEYAEAVREMYSQDKGRYIISPILIYRELLY